MALDARAAAARILAAVLKGQSLNTAMPTLLAEVSDRDRGLTQQLCYGTLRAYPRLIAVLEKLLEKPLRGKDRDVLALLLIGLYQLDALRVPDHAAVAATVDATRKLGKPWAKGLTNAVLRRFLRERAQLTETLDEAARNSHPLWLFRKIHRQWPTHAEAILRANNGPPPMSVRINRLRVTREDYLQRLLAQGINATASSLCSEGIRLEQPQDVAALPGFAEGELSVQDEAAQLAAGLLAPRPGDRVLDACAAPGGKACHILELQPELDELVAADVDRHRLIKVTENLQRLQLQATLLVADASASTQAYDADSFDRILVDAPCSASGVIRRHPDVKILRRPEDIHQMADQQLAILTGLWPALRAGGLLLYATCSIFEEENSAVIAKFLLSHSDAVNPALECDWGETTSNGRQLLPCESGSDGLFYAFLRKAS